MTVIASNVSALRAQNATTTANAGLQQAMERLSTGKRINSRRTTPPASPSPPR